ncbi:carboxymuconolactone decarboxylase family protein [Pseudomaricurvus alkylphenolicus]|uniref:carboxymuconolactone decarboxylase family protein n=1 Tax=Pseudomaricurvus alkylphenolicus TaxID=1306991 RepID=UPI0014206E28|nr:carboxymuconolactone decarboxylase family protein [Pseudomaricurvus alkylphenolicus]NIB40768.1 carboxymuconolactone decarboxylase family protein [Pseudomaricurvus alkylphenolicus]
MPRISPVNLQTTDPQTRATLEGVKAKIGMVPNLYATFAQSPAVLQAFLGFGEALTGGRLNAAQREIIALAVAQTNECHYCLSAHTLVGKGAGLSSEQMMEARKKYSNDPLALLARSIVERRGALADEEIKLAKSAGFDDELLVEITAVVTLNLLTNYTNHLADTDIDFPPVDPNL